MRRSRLPTPALPTGPSGKWTSPPTCLTPDHPGPVPNDPLLLEDPKEGAARLAALPSLDTTVSFRVHVFQKAGQEGGHAMTTLPLSSLWTPSPTSSSPGIPPPSVSSPCRRPLMQRVAQENNLSETAFLTKTGDDYALRWFTPAGEIDLCGHATLAAAHVVLTQLEPGRQQVTFHTCSGPLPVQKQGDRYEMDFPRHTLSPVPVTEAMAAAFGARPTAAYLGRDLLCVFDREETVGASPRTRRPSEGWRASSNTPPPGAGRQTASPAPLPPSAGVPEDPVCGPATATSSPTGPGSWERTIWWPGRPPPGRHPLRHPGGGTG